MENGRDSSRRPISAARTLQGGQPSLALFVAILGVVFWSAGREIAAQDSPEKAFNTIRGTVINSLTREPIGRALVFSPDNRFATMTDSYGTFEFKVPPEDNPSTVGVVIGDGPMQPNRPYMLSARKPGFLEDPNQQNRLLDSSSKEITISLTPEALIIGHVALPSSQPPDAIQVEIYRREVRDGLAHWVSAGMTQSRSNGEFRFAELPAGTYKLLTHELLDRDPQTSMPGQQLYGYAPVYYAKASDFASAAPIQLTAGKVYEAQLSLVRQPYYPIKIPVAGGPPGGQFNVDVSVQGRGGPGFSLGYVSQNQTIEGLLPNGTYKVEAQSYEQQGGAGALTITVNGPLNGPQLTVVSNPPIAVNVKEEFSQTDSQPIRSSINGVQVASGPRTYLNVYLESADDFTQGRGYTLRPPAGPDDRDLLLQNVPPGRYWVRISSGHGYVASATSGSINLLRQPLVVPLGAEVSPIEVTVRDDIAEVEFSVEGSKNSTATVDSTAKTVAQNSTPVYIYCIPIPDSTGQYSEMAVMLGNGITTSNFTPGTYHFLAFSRQQPGIEYRNPEAMRVYDGKGQVVRVAAATKEHVQLSLISASE